MKKDVTQCRERLQEESKAKQKTSDEDEAWLDGAGNLVDEERVTYNFLEMPLTMTQTRHLNPQYPSLSHPLSNIL